MGLVEAGGGVQGDDFGAEEVVAGGDVGLLRRQSLMSSFEGRSAVLGLTGIFTSTLPQQLFMSFTPHQSLSPTPWLAGAQVLAKILNQGVEPSAVRASETLLRYA